MMETTVPVHIGGRIRCSPDELEILKAMENYTMVFFKDGSKIMVATTLGKILGRLASCRFARINRSLVVNLDRIQVDKNKGTVYHQLIGEILISRRRMLDFYEKIRL